MFQLTYLEKVRRDKYIDLFSLLNPNSYGIINKATVTGVKLSQENYSRFGRIVDELISLDEQLNFEEFCKALEILEKEDLEKLSPGNSLDIPDELV